MDPVIHRYFYYFIADHKMFRTCDQSQAWPLRCFRPQCGREEQNRIILMRYIRSTLTCNKGPKTITLLGLSSFRVHADTVRNMFTFSDISFNQHCGGGYDAVQHSKSHGGPDECGRRTNDASLVDWDSASRLRSGVEWHGLEQICSGLK